MNKLGKTLLEDITTVLNRPVFTKEEELILIDLMDKKINIEVENKVLFYKNENENLTNFIAFQIEDPTDFMDILF